MHDDRSGRCAHCGAPSAELLLVALPGPIPADIRTVARCCPRCTLEISADPRREIAGRVEAAYDPDRAAALAAASQELDPRLPPLLDAVVGPAAGPHVDRPAFVAALDALLVFLTRHGSHAHCRYASETVSRTGTWVHLPAPYGELMRTIGGPMRDAAWDRPLAERLRATPAQLLAALRALGSNDAPGG